MPDYFRSLLVVSLLVLLAIKCFSIARRPRANTKAPLGLGLYFAAFGVLGVTDLLGEGSLLGRMVRGLLGGVGCLGLVAAISLAIWGLVEIRRHPERWIQGRSQGWWAVGLTVLLGLALVGSAANSVRKERPRQGLAVAQVSAAQITFEELNFGVTVAEPWQRLTKVDEFAEDATVGFMRADPPMFFLIIAELLDVGVETYADIVTANLADSADALGDVDRSAFELNGLKGVLLESDALVGSVEFDYVHFLSSRNGFAYQLVAWSSSTADREPLASRAAEVFGGFEVLDLDRVAEPEHLAEHQSAYGYSLEPERVWFEWDAMANEVPAADFGGLTGEGAAFVVLPLILPETPVTDHDLLRALLHEINIDLNASAVERQDVFTEDAVTGFDLEVTDVVDASSYQNVVHLRRSPHFAYLVAAWRDLDIGVEAERLSTVTNALRVDAGKPRLSVLELDTEAERASHARIYSLLAGELETRGAQEGAQALYREGFTLYPQATSAALALLASLDRASDFEAGLELFKEFPTELSGANETQSYYPYFLTRLDRAEEGADAYSELFSGRWVSDGDFELYLDLLWQLGRYDEAVHRAATYHQLGSSQVSRIMLASAHRRRGDISEAIALLAGDSPEVLPLNSRQALELIACHYDAGSHDLVLALAAESIARNGADASTLLLRGRSELALSMLDAALVSLEEALMMDPFLVEAAALLEQVRESIARGYQRS